MCEEMHAPSYTREVKQTLTLKLFQHTLDSTRATRTSHLHIEYMLLCSMQMNKYENAKAAGSWLETQHTHTHTHTYTHTQKKKTKKLTAIISEVESLR